jgi:hypothetical protein
MRCISVDGICIGALWPANPASILTARLLHASFFGKIKTGLVLEAVAERVNQPSSEFVKPARRSRDVLKSLFTVKGWESSSVG